MSLAPPHTLHGGPQISVGETAAVTLRYETVLRWVYVPFIFSGCIAIIEPSPYDFLSLLFLPFLIFSGIKLYKTHIPILTFWLVYMLAGFVALLPYWGETWGNTNPTLFQFQSLYLVITFVMFLMFLSQNTLERTELTLKAFTAGCVVGAIIGIGGFLGITELNATVTGYEGRVAGLFKDPNAFGSYMILASVYLLQLLLLDITRFRFLTFLAYVTIMIGIFLSFSRGSIGATLFASAVIMATSFLTCGSARLRQRIALACITGLILIVIAAAIALSIEQLRDLIDLRFNTVQEYDAGPTGRFGNQIRSIPMLLDLPNGFGPLRFRLTFLFDPHSSYINAFASYGWMGGFAWLLIVATTCWVGIRLMFTPSPFRRMAQVWFVALFALLLQGFQIDIDHWRWVFLCFAAVWGLETARVQWLKTQVPQAV